MISISTYTFQKSRGDFIKREFRLQELQEGGKKVVDVVTLTLTQYQTEIILAVLTVNYPGFH